MDILEVLLFIALIAVIFGVSMHDAFWGIVAFAGGVILSSIVILLIKVGIIHIGKKIEYLTSEDGKKARQQKLQARKKSLLDDILLSVGFIWLTSPFTIEIVFHTTPGLKEFAEKNDLIVLLIALAVFFIPPFVILIFSKPKKRTPPKAR